MINTKESLPGIGQIALLLIGFLSILYTFLNRRVEIIFKGAVYVSITILLIMFFTLLIIYLSDRSIKFRTENFFSSLGIILLLGLTFYSFGTILEDLSNYKNLEFLNFHRNWLIPLAATSIFVCGLILFYFRFYIKSIYGLMEVIVGIFIGTAKISENFYKVDTPDFYLIILTASLYLIVRGLDNLYHGLIKDSNDLIAKKLIKRKDNFQFNE